MSTTTSPVSSFPFPTSRRRNSGRHVTLVTAMRLWLLLLVPFLTLSAPAQSNSAKPGTGTVTGHVYCADTNAPARMARVQLESLHDEAERSASHSLRSSHVLLVPAGGVVDTALDGSFTLSNVPPGSYYVIASAEGYLSPRADADDFDDAVPNPPAGQPPLVVPRVDVQADQTASIDVRLERGAAVSGTIRYDDGAPASGVHITLMHKNKKGEWISSRHTSFASISLSRQTDDLGHYRISGLRDRDYIAIAVLTQSETQSGGPHAIALRGIERSTLMIYSGDTFRRSDAVPFHLGSGEEHAGEDITIPLSKLHSVNGVVIAARDSHAINSGFIDISTPEDKQTIASGEIDSDGSFHLDCVPEGTYLLRIFNPRDSTSHDITVGKSGLTLLDENTLHQYGDLEQSIKVEGDIPNLVLAVPEQKKVARTSSP